MRIYSPQGHTVVGVVAFIAVGVTAVAFVSQVALVWLIASDCRDTGTGRSRVLSAWVSWQVGIHTPGHPDSSYFLFAVVGRQTAVRRCRSYHSLRNCHRRGGHPAGLPE
jgi:hypothetical protein